jgi:hypothetical protein
MVTVDPEHTGGRSPSRKDDFSRGATPLDKQARIGLSQFSLNEYLERDRLAEHLGLRLMVPSSDHGDLVDRVFGQSDRKLDGAGCGRWGSGWS